MGKIAYRRVAPDWEHPQDEKGNFIPLGDGTKLAAEQAYWDECKRKWDMGFVHIHGDARSNNPGERIWAPKSVGVKSETMEEYYGERPDPKHYTPTWTKEQATAWQVYNEVSEGMPISPVWPDLETMARAIAAENGHSYEAMRKKILATLLYGYWYVPVSEFELGQRYCDLELYDFGDFGV